MFVLLVSLLVFLSAMMATVLIVAMLVRCSTRRGFASLLVLAAVLGLCWLAAQGGRWNPSLAQPHAPGRAVAGEELPDRDAPTTASQPPVDSSSGSEVPVFASPGDASPGDDRADAPRVIDPQLRPAWVESPPLRDGSVHTIAVSSGPFQTLGECRRQLEDESLAAVREYADDFLRANGAAPHLDIDERYVRSHLLTEEHTERVQFSFGPMHQVHGLLRVDESFRNELRRRWREVVVLSRLAQVGLVLVGVMVLVGVVFAYLKLDALTGGRRRGRLRIAAAAVILALVASGALVAQRMPWL